MNAVIEVENLQKTFVVRKRAGLMRRERVRVRAVDSVTFSIARGEMVGYIGPNGAGKSTTVKMLTGILVPTDGRVRVAGFEPSRERVKLARRIGVVFGQRSQLWWDLPLMDSFALLRHIYRIPEDRFGENVTTFTELLELGPFLQTPVRQLSLGQRMRGELTAAMLHDPEVLFLDEPTIGLDVVARARVREFLQRINRERQVTILLTTHDLIDIERLCDRMLIIDRGHVVYDGGVESFVDEFGGERTLIVDLEEPGEPLNVPGAAVIKTDGPRQWLRFRRAESSAASILASVAQQAKIADLTIAEPDIEEIVRRLYVESSVAHREASDRIGE